MCKGVKLSIQFVKMYLLKGDKYLEPQYFMDFDGGSNPNPGPCAGAFVIYNHKNEILLEGGKYIEHGTNNIGEYTGLLQGLQSCLENKIKSVSIQGDSKLVVSQVAKVWKVNHPELLRLRDEILDLVKQMDYVSIRHVLRNKNKQADKLSDETLEKKYSWVRIINY
jgi:ribonuclease HI